MNVAFVLPGGMELWIVLILALLLFGHRIPGMARSLGSGITEFKKGLRSGTADELPPPDRKADAAEADTTRSREHQSQP